MKNYQLNKMKMFDTVQSVIAQHQSAWMNNSPFSDAYNEFSTKLDSLKSLTTEYINSSKGLTAIKKVTLEKTIDQAIVLGNVIGAFALKNNDTELLMRNIYTRSEWVKGNSLIKVNRFKQLLTDAESHEADLLEYGIDSGFIQTFEASVYQFEELMKQPRIAIVGRKQLTKQIAELILEIDTLLNGQIDRIMNVFTLTDPKFFATFKNARIIVDHKGKRNKLTNKNVPKEPDDGDRDASIE